MWKNQFWKVKNSPLELEKNFIEFKDIELKDKEVKVKREIEELFLNRLLCLKMILISLEKKEMKKIKPIKNTCYDWLINFIP